MTFFIQIFGLIINIYLVFLFTSRTISKLTSYSNSAKALIPSSIRSQYWLNNLHNDQNRLELLNRISILLLISYFIIELDFFFATYNLNLLELSLIDGSIKLTNTKSLINLGIFIVTIIL